MNTSARERFLAAARGQAGARPVVSPFLPHPSVVSGALALLQLPPRGDAVADEIRLSQAIDYEPMFMTECTGLIFPWAAEGAPSASGEVLKVIRTRKGTWTRRAPLVEPAWSDASGCGVRTPADHAMLAAVCEEIEDRRDELRAYFRAWRRRVGDNGVIVLGHPHPSWLGYQIAPSQIFLQWNEDPFLYGRSMEAIAEASLVVMGVALEEGIDFMSDSSYGLEMTSPALFAAMDLPWIRKYADWTHDRGALFWYHNCGSTRRMILDGTFNKLGADVIETIAPPPEGDNDLAESRRHLDAAVCSKGNLSLGLLRHGSPAEVAAGAAAMAAAVRGFRHIYSTADAVLPGTPPENFLAFVRSLRCTTD